MEKVVLEKKLTYSWWFDSYRSPRRSQWLESTVSEIDEKTKAMLKLIEEDADSFSQRAEMYYKKRPELINMVEDFYRAHRSLAERYDQLKSDSTGARLVLPFASPISGKSIPVSCKGLDLVLEVSSDNESEIDDPEYKECIKEDERMDVARLLEEVNRLKEENRVQKCELMAKDEEKREAIRQLCMALDLSKEENRRMTKCLKEFEKERSRGLDRKKHGSFLWRILGRGD